MLSKHWQFPILLVVLVCIHAVCPLFCAAFGQKLCSSSSEKIQMEYADNSSSCCHKTDATGESETPSESETACCLTNVELILPNASYNGDIIRESLTHQIVSIVPFSANLSADQEKLLHLLPPPKLFSSLLNSDISRRGPPYPRS